MKVVKVEVPSFETTLYSSMKDACPVGEGYYSFSGRLKDRGWVFSDGAVYTIVDSEVKKKRREL